jgi:hypothetical protein
MFAVGQFKINNNVNKTTGRAPFDLILRFRPEMRINIETVATENNYNISGKIPAARREIKLRKRDANLVRDI